nr:uncharacterized protein LOC127303089 [Lolium perenne]
MPRAASSSTSSSYAAAASSTSRAPASGHACVRARASNNSDRPRPGKRGTTPLPRARPWSAAPPPAPSSPARPASVRFLQTISVSSIARPAGAARLLSVGPATHGAEHPRPSWPPTCCVLGVGAPVRAPWRRRPPIPECSRRRRPPLLDVLDGPAALLGGGLPAAATCGGGLPAALLAAATRGAARRRPRVLLPLDVMG